MSDEEAPTGAGGEHLDPERVAEMMASGEARLIDVRSAHEWEAGRLAGATRIELAELSERAGEIDRDRTVVFCCRGGNRSSMAAQAFREAGYDAHNLAGGLLAWERGGHPLEPEAGYVAESGEAAAVLEARRRAPTG